MIITKIPKGSELFDWRLGLYDDGIIVNLTTLTISLTINFPTPLTKTVGFTRAATTPNLTVEWAPGELDVPRGIYQATITATTSGLDYKWTLPIEIV